MSNQYNLRNRIIGAYMGAAAGDALGGPIEGWHAKMIKAAHGTVTGFLPYTRPLHPGYALRPDPGAITDDTFIRDDFADFVLANPNEDDRSPETLVDFLLTSADFDFWWRPAIVPLRKIESGEMGIHETKTILMGGGAGWWTPFGLIHAGKPQKAYDETTRLAEIWRQPFEQNLIGATQAAVAASMLPDATVKSVSDTLFHYAGPLARKLLERTQRIAQEHEGDQDGFIEAIYAEALITECTTEIDGPMPPRAEATDPYRGGTVLWAEQIPLAYGALIFGDGDFVKTMLTSISLGRDTDSIGTTCGTWIGGLVGLQGIPSDWVDTMQRVNLEDLDLLGRANQLADLAGA